jgi:hypothetical protein
VPDTPTTNTGCQVCSAPTGDAGQLCRTHTDDLTRDLQTVPDLVQELEITRTRQARITAEKHGGRSAERPLPWNEHAAACASDLNTTLNAWALDTSRLAEDERDHLDEHHYTDTTAIAAWLTRNLPTLRQHQEAGQAFDELTHAIREARRAVDRPLERIFAGQCLEEHEDGWVCREDLYAAPGKTTATCKVCGARHDMAKRREWMLACIEDQVAYSGLLAGLVSNLGVQIGSSTIRRYASAGRIKVISVDAKRRPLYRIGDVLDVFLKRAA